MQPIGARVQSGRGPLSGRARAAHVAYAPLSPAALGGTSAATAHGPLAAVPELYRTGAHASSLNGSRRKQLVGAALCRNAGWTEAIPHGNACGGDRRAEPQNRRQCERGWVASCAGQRGKPRRRRARAAALRNAGRRRGEWRWRVCAWRLIGCDRGREESVWCARKGQGDSYAVTAAAATATAGAAAGAAVPSPPVVAAAAAASLPVEEAAPAAAAPAVPLLNPLSGVM